MESAAYSFSARVQASAAPPIPKAAHWATRYRPTPSEPLINLSQGVPGAPPPQIMLDKLADATRDPATTGYGPLAGNLSLREAVARQANGLYAVHTEERRIRAENVAITAGCNLAFYASMLALAEPGDEVILPSPWYFNNHMTLEQLNLSLVPLPCSAPSFLPSPQACARLITPRTKAIVLVTPNNPTGAIYPPELLREFAELARERKVALVLDETYRDFVEEPPHHLFAETEWPTYLIHLFSFSKSYAIPGHRLGGLIASPSFLSQIGKLLDCIQICPARPAQRAVEWAIEGLADWRRETRMELQERQKVFRELVRTEADGWEVATGGAYFAYVKHPFKGASSELVSQRLAEQVGIITLPGTFFSPSFGDLNEDRYIRFSIANVNEATLRRVPARLKKLNELWETL
ncbi:hypothetical protein JCM10908_002760 [Rhodotorula pacifica]|uniref:uncharacterized protein n=1 Tax=Rhodotorula pacifica TaxID=1495444 RepID=UPI00317A81B8